MEEKEILSRLKSAVDQAPIDLLDKIQNTKVEKIHAHDHITAQEDLRQTKSLESKIIPLSNYFRNFALAASLLLIVALGGNYYQNMPIGEIFLDINPSFSVEVKRNNKIKDINPLNADGFEVVKGQDFEDLTYSQALTKLVKLAEEEGYLREEINLVMLSSNSDLKPRLDEAAQDIAKAYEDSSTNLTVLKQEVRPEDPQNGLAALLKHIADKEGLDLDKMNTMGLEELISYLVANKVDLSKYLDIQGDLPKKKEREKPRLEETETEATEVMPLINPVTEEDENDDIEDDYSTSPPSQNYQEDDYDDDYDDSYDDDYHDGNDDSYNDDYYDYDENSYDDDYDDNWDDNDDDYYEDDYEDDGDDGDSDDD